MNLLTLTQWKAITYASNTVFKQQDAREDSQSYAGSQTDGKDIAHPHKYLRSSTVEPMIYTCAKCSKTFKTAGALSQHRMEPLSHVEPIIPCPHNGCECKFKAVSCIAHHMESGSHGHTRHDVTDIVHKLDKNGTISIHRRIGDSPTNGKKETYTYYATEETFNGRGYKCPLCDRVCKTLNSLNAHLNSAAHDKMEFRCWKCERLFKLVSALAQHLEACMCDTDTARRLDDHISRLANEGAVTVGSADNNTRTAIREWGSPTASSVESHISRLVNKKSLPKRKIRSEDFC
ncbi:hypothetical protein CVT25_003142 [Psilocybe cyanescens]|uniref:C2H2-type domain-containing protein n=1 Tax=Psilocybe cyanescens TaxID=93625 RepID=A0A409XK62_PSICY|nr:hypothetical protein CVT25_003142 [Psilocybe cyanescens]